MGHLRWPQLDIDLSIESIVEPDVFPMVYKKRSNHAMEVMPVL